jgi:hypothetical protein
MALVRFLIFQENFGGAFENIRKNSRQRPLQLSVLLVFLLVPRSKRSRRISLFPNEGLEQMARKNDGACGNPNTSTARSSCDGAKSLSWLLRILHSSFPADLRFLISPGMM